jgi:OOP family OmpA-OmpF porin
MPFCENARVRSQSTLTVILGTALTLVVVLTFVCVGNHGAAVAAALAEAQPPRILPLEPTEPACDVYPSGGVIYVAGAFPDDASRARILEAAQRAFPGTALKDTTTIVASARNRPWLAHMPAFVAELPKLREPALHAFGENIRIGGSTDADAQRLAVVGAIRAGMGGGEVIDAISVRSKAEQAQTAVNTFLESHVIEFESGSNQLTDGGRATVLAFARVLLKEDVSLRLEIDGHTDNSGTVLGNRKLSGDRASAVKDVLVEAGIAEYRMTTHGYGSERPLADNGTEEGKKKNRRIEIHVR